MDDAEEEEGMMGVTPARTDGLFIALNHKSPRSYALRFSFSAIGVRTGRWKLQNEWMLLGQREGVNEGKQKEQGGPKEEHYFYPDHSPSLHPCMVLPPPKLPVALTQSTGSLLAD
uniref:Uncharacterized protein n=1 Tax=Knipowitschia caucasica TaxID=637954 RepID=A0AAV2KYF2_KNICA